MCAMRFDRFIMTSKELRAVPARSSQPVEPSCHNYGRAAERESPTPWTRAEQGPLTVFTTCWTARRPPLPTHEVSVQYQPASACR